MIQFREVEFSDINDLRTDYLCTLTEFQELYLEILIENSTFYKIEFDNILAGWYIQVSNATFWV